jgi:hypothetical protein
MIDGVSQAFSNWTDMLETYIYVNYTHSVHRVVIVPEFPTAAVFVSTVIVTLSIAFTSKKRRMNKTAGLSGDLP